MSLLPTYRILGKSITGFRKCQIHSSWVPIYVAPGRHTGSFLRIRAEISYQPNNRLLVSETWVTGMMIWQKNKIIGGVDVEYILTENGNYVWRHIITPSIDTHYVLHLLFRVWVLCTKRHSIPGMNWSDTTGVWFPNLYQSLLTQLPTKNQRMKPTKFLLIALCLMFNLPGSIRPLTAILWICLLSSCPDYPVRCGSSSLNIINPNAATVSAISLNTMCIY